MEIHLLSLIYNVDMQKDRNFRNMCFSVQLEEKGKNRKKEEDSEYSEHKNIGIGERKRQDF